VVVVVVENKKKIEEESLRVVIRLLDEAYVQPSDRVGVRARNTIPLLVTRIAIEPVGVASPVGTIGGSVQVHESLSCKR